MRMPWSGHWQAFVHESPGDGSTSLPHVHHLGVGRCGPGCVRSCRESHGSPMVRLGDTAGTRHLASPGREAPTSREDPKVQSFTPAAGNPKLTKYYDTVVALMARERRWRTETVRQLSLKPGEVVVDVGCGTGSLAVMMKRHESGARVIGVDPDPEVLAIAGEKTRKAGVAVEFVCGMGDKAAELVGPGTADKTVSSLVLHQCPVPMKRAIIANMFQLLRPGGELVIADFGL